MSMPRGLAKATAYYNNLEAWREWRELANKVEQAGMVELVKKFSPPENAGWRKVDKAKAALRQAFQQLRAVDQPTACPACGTLPEEMEHDPTCPLVTAGN